MRTIIIGDIHGCDQMFHALLDKLKPGLEDRMILLGDLFDRGTESWEVFQTVQKLDESMGERFVLLKGNHEDYLLIRHYLLLSTRINALAAAEKLGLEREELAKRLPQPELDAPLKLREYFTQVLRCVIAMRDEESIRQSGGIVDSAIEYIDLHYTEENISLNTVARAINVSTNYLSAEIGRAHV